MSTDTRTVAPALTPADPITADPVDADRPELDGSELLAEGGLLRLATAGSVDDGKSTLVGRLLFDSKSILADQLDAVERVSQERGLTGTDLALLTDGLRAEREQGITVDVAYRYFATPRRTFILADCPGHVQYTRNTVTGSSTADVLVVLVDVRHGILEQTRRHLAVGALLRVPHVIVAINKLDLVDYDAGEYHRVAADARLTARRLGIADLITVPVSALVGDNVVDRSTRTPWYSGGSLLEILESIEPGRGVEEKPLRFPVQYVLRPQQAAASTEFTEYRGYAGQIGQGSVAPGDEVVVLPGGRRTRVVGVDTADGSLERAIAPQSVALRLADDIDITRGDLIAAVDGAPEPVTEIDAMVAWLGDRPLHPGDRVFLKHATRTVQARVDQVRGRLDLDTAELEAASCLELNDIGRVSIRLASPILAEDYAESRTGGAFLLVDAAAGLTLAAGMIRPPEAEAIAPENDIDWQI